MKNESIDPEVFEVATYVGELIRASRASKMLRNDGFNVVVEAIDIDRDASSMDVFRFATLAIAGHFGEWRFTYGYDLPRHAIEIRTEILPRELPAKDARLLFNLFESSRLAGFGLVLSPSNRGGIDVTGVSFRVMAKGVDEFALIGSLQRLAKFAEETVLRLRGDVGNESLADHWNEHLLRQ